MNRRERMESEANPSLDTGGTLSDQAYLTLKQMIGEGRIRPGDRLLEAHVARSFGTSRSPIRQALQMLAEEGLIVSLELRGYRAAGEADDDAGDRLADLGEVKLSSPRQWELMYDEVEQEVLSQVLFGTVRINDHRLAQHYGVSRTVTRDLLARMHGFGLVSKDQSGHWIAEQVTPEKVKHLYDLRLLLEPRALSLAAPHVPEAQLVKARDNVVAALGGSTVESAAFDKTEVDLHIDILGYCENKEILSSLRKTHVLFGPTRHLFDPILRIPLDMIEDALNEHRVIIENLLSGDADRASNTLYSHLDGAIERWLVRFQTSRRHTEIAFPPYLSPINS